MEKEIWKDVIGYEGVYIVSNHGNIKSLNRTVKHIKHGSKTIKGRVLKKTNTPYGYYSVNLCVNNKRNKQRIHRLVGMSFIENTNNKPEINHKNGIKTDNNVSNLEWVTSSENQKHAFKIGLQKPSKPWLNKKGKNHHSSKEVLQYSRNGVLIGVYGSAHEAMRITGIGNSYISLCCRGKVKTAKGYIWKYKM